MNQLDKTQQCPDCGRYANRGVSVDAVIVRDKKVLLIQRGVEPNKGYWGIPGGYVGWDESAEDAVKREVKEETGLDVGKIYPVGVHSDPKRHPQQVINLVYLVQVFDGVVRHGDDTQDIKWFSLNSLPKEMALDHKQNIQEAIKLLNKF